MRFNYNDSFKKLLTATFILLCLGTGLHSQITYDVGFGQVSINPPTKIYSLALAGYGSPKDGRFSLEWTNTNQTVQATFISGNRNHLYATSNDELLQGDINQSKWKKIAQIKNIKSLAVNSSRIFYANSNNQIFSSPLSKIKWNRWGSLNDLKCFTTTDNQLFAALEDGAIWMSEIKAANPNFKLWTHLDSVISLATDASNLLALTTSGDIYKMELANTSRSWVKIARYNGITDDVKATNIALSGNRIFCTDKRNLYIGNHASEENTFVTCTAIKRGTTKTVIVSIDLVGIDRKFVDGIKNEICKNMPLEYNSILVNLSHTHFAPVSQNYPTWADFLQKPDKSFLYGIIKPAIINAVAMALKDLQPSMIEFGRGSAAIGKNRSLEGAAATYDDAVDVLKITRKKDSDKIVLFLTGCHPVFSKGGRSEFTISGNYPSLTRKMLSDKFSISKSQFIQGCAGDINPIDNDPMTTATKLSAAIATILHSPMDKISGAISFAYDSVLVPANNIWSKDSISNFKQVNSDATDVTSEKNVRWANIMLKKYNDNKLPSQMPVYIQHVDIGNWKLIGLSREVVTDYSIGIKKLFPNQLVSVAAYCNDVASYLPTYKHIEAKTYEGYDSFFWYGQPTIFPKNIYDLIIDKVKKTSNK